MALDPLTIIMLFSTSNMTCSYDFPSSDNKRRTNSWVGLFKVFLLELSPVMDYYNAFSLASNDLVLKRIQIGKLYDCGLKG